MPVIMLEMNCKKCERKRKCQKSQASDIKDTQRHWRPAFFPVQQKKHTSAKNRKQHEAGTPQNGFRAPNPSVRASGKADNTPYPGKYANDEKRKRKDDSNNIPQCVFHASLQSSIFTGDNHLSQYTCPRCLLQPVIGDFGDYRTKTLQRRAADPRGPERAAAAFRLPGAVIAGTDWRQEKSCRLFAFLGPCGAASPQGRETGQKAGLCEEKGACWGGSGRQVRLPAPGRGLPWSLGIRICILFEKIIYESGCKVLFAVRRDAETNLWFETGSWDDVRKKTPAVTVYEEIRNVPVCSAIIDGKKVFRTFHLREEARKIKRGELRSGDIMQSSPEIPQPE